MRGVIIGFLLSIYALNGYTKDLTFSCIGNIEEDYTFNTNQPSHYEIKDKLGLVIKEKQMVLVGSKNLDVPILYEKNGKTNFDFIFPICRKKNYEIFANNYSCDINVINIVMADMYQITFNGLTNVLNVLIIPTTKKQIQMDANKSSYKTLRASYECKPISSSL